MNGVMRLGVSAGSNHVGASEMWTAHVICPEGAASAGVTLAIARSATTMTATRGIVRGEDTRWLMRSALLCRTRSRGGGVNRGVASGDGEIISATLTRVREALSSR